MKITLANTLGIGTLILWVGCATLVALFPQEALVVTQWWMHGMDLSVLGGWNLTVSNFIWGGLTLGASAWLTGFVFGWVGEMLKVKKEES